MLRVALGVLLTPLHGRHGLAAQETLVRPTPTAVTTPRVTVGVGVATPRARSTPRALLRAGLAGSYADGPDKMPSA